MSTVNLIFYNFDKQTPLLNELARYYQNSSKIDVDAINDLNEVNQFISTTNNGIVIFKISNKAELQQAVMVLKSQRKLIKNHLVKPACFISVRNKKVESILAKYGCTDLLEPSTKAKTMSFKIDFWSKPIHTQLQKIEKEMEQKAAKKEKAESTNKKEDKKEDFIFSDALDLASDFWILKSKVDCKKILRRYLIRVLGPSPHIGNWIELENKSNNGLSTWKFVLKDQASEDYIKDDGAWFFNGNKPEFDWKINRWNFPSEMPHLYFYSKSGDAFSRFKFKGTHVEVAENSEYALAREEMILETCDSKFNFENDQLKGDAGENIDGEGDTDHLKDLEGKTKGEGDLASDPLSGKSSTDEINGDPLSGKSSTDEIDGDPLSGKSSTDEYGADPLSGKGHKADAFEDLNNKDKRPSGIGEDSNTDPYGGKNKTDHLGSDPLSGKGHEADAFEDLNNKDKKPSGIGEDDDTDPFGGKNKTDHLGSDPLSGKGHEADAFEDLNNKDKKPSGIGEDDNTDPYGGKNKTDHLGADPLSGKGHEADSLEDLNNNDKKPSGIDEKKNTDPLSGKNKSDHIEDDIDGDGFAADQYKGLDNKGKKNSGIKNNEDENPYGGKTSTDEYGKDPLGGKGSAADRDKDLDNNGKKYGTDHIENPELGGKTSTDEYGKDPLGGKGSAADRDKDLDNNGKKYATDHIENPELGGKTSTDEYGKDPLAGKGSAADRDKDLDNNGKNYSTDHLGEGALGGRGSSADEFKNLQNRSSQNIDQNQKDNQENPFEDDHVYGDDDLIDDSVGQNGFEAVDLEDPFGDHTTAPIIEDIPEDPFSEDLTAKLEEKYIDGIDDALKNKPDDMSEEDYLADLRAKKELARKRALDDEGAGDYFNDKKRKQAQLRERQEELDRKDELKQREEHDQSESLTDKNKVNLKSVSGSDLYDDEDTKARRKGHADRTASDGVYDKSNKAAFEKSQEMEDALGGGVSLGSNGESGGSDPSSDELAKNTIIDNSSREADKKTPDLKQIIEGTPVDLNLESGELKVILKQETEVGNEITFICEFEDFYEDELIVKAPKNSLKSNTEVKAAVGLKYAGQKIKVSCSGIIEEIEEDDDKYDSVVVSIQKIDPAQYEKFLKLYTERQASINDFLERAKGY